ncbi:MAG: hypothetical protein LBM67_04830 [Lentimicrobiaceae bacterium]|jgi:hypothetical protein|nr:hypothetical protein [Lentimicrobiaceae bacterium]
MKLESYVIEPLKGFGNLKFGQTIDDTIKLLGEAEDVEELEEDTISSVVLNYDADEFSVFFEGETKSVIAYFETENAEAVLFGEKVFEMDSEDIIALMTQNGFKNLEEDEEEGEKRVTFEDALIDFYFDNDDKLIAVGWGVFVNNQGEIEQI